MFFFKKTSLKNDFDEKPSEIPGPLCLEFGNWNETTQLERECIILTSM